MERYINDADGLHKRPSLLSLALWSWTMFFPRIGSEGATTQAEELREDSRRKRSDEMSMKKQRRRRLKKGGREFCVSQVFGKEALFLDNLDKMACADSMWPVTPGDKQWDLANAPQFFPLLQNGYIIIWL